MVNKKSSEGRRKLLKSIAVGSGAVIAGKSLPENWARPVIDSVMLPAHAQTSTAYSGATTVQSVMREPDSLFARALDTIVPEANADLITKKVSWCIIPVNETQADVTFLVHRDVVEPLYATMYTARATVGVEKILLKSGGCSNAAADANDWLDKFGLVKDAQASCAAFVTLDGLNINDPFEFISSCDGLNLNDTLQADSTCPTPIVCNLK